MLEIPWKKKSPKGSSKILPLKIFNVKIVSNKKEPLRIMLKIIIIARLNFVTGKI